MSLSGTFFFSLQYPKLAFQELKEKIVKGVIVIIMHLRIATPGLKEYLCTDKRKLTLKPEKNVWKLTYYTQTLRGSMAQGSL